MSLPPCKDWNIWVGHEVEGYRAIGMPTVFVRRFVGEANSRNLALKGKNHRIWFCGEFLSFPLFAEHIREALDNFEEVCIEWNLMLGPKELPADLLARCKIYVTTGVSLKKGDHVSVGINYDLEFFQVGRGRKTKPADYKEDTFIA